MMHRCNGHGSSSSSYGPCSCNSSSSNFSMLFHNYDQTAEMSSYYSSSVDCTLSLGTPSTRSNNNVDYNYNTSHEKRRSSSSSSNCMSNFCWDILQSNKHSNSSHKTGRGSSNSGGNGGGGGETLLARRCANCDTTSTPLWRNGPKGPKSLCNACGIRFKKEERRATAAAATTNGGGNGGGVDGQHMLNSSSSWINHHHHHHQKVPYISAAPYNGNEFRFIDHDDDRDSADNNGISFLSWRLNVTDRPAGLVHEFTR